MHSSSRYILLKDLLKHSMRSSSLKSASMFSIDTKNRIDSQKHKTSFNVSKDFFLNSWLVKKPLNLLFSIDQFFFEFSKRRYQQKKTGEFLKQLRERKKLTRFYGHFTRKQLVQVFEKIKNRKGSLFTNFFHSLESRLDIVVYRSGFARTVAQARQLIQHRKIQINGIPVRNSGIQLSPGDVISFVPKGKPPLACPFSMRRTRPLLTREDPSIVLHGPLHSQWKDGNKNMYENSLIQSLKNSPEFLDLKKRKGSLKVFSLFSGATPSRSKTKHGWSGLVFHSFLKLLSTRIKRRSVLRFKHFTQSMILVALKWKSQNRFHLDKVQNRSQTASQATLDYLLLKPTISNGTSYHVSSKAFPHLHSLREKMQERTLKKPSWGSTQSELRKANTSALLGAHPGRANNLFKNSHKNRAFREFSSQRKVRATQRIATYRKSFLVLINQLKNDAFFSHFLSPLLQKNCLKRSFSKKKKIFLRDWTFRVMKPIHLEISYKILEIIYLFSPQRLHFPFCIDLEGIQRSIR